MKSRSLHNLSHFRNTTGHMGQINLIGAVEVLHGDTFKAHSNLFMRLSPLAAPTMHPVHVQVQHVYVPYRQIWEDWENFITGGEDFDDASVLPTIDFSGSPVTKGSLANQIGLPVGYAGTASALPFRAYAAWWNEFVRDDQLQDKVGLSIEGGADTTTNTDLLRANWNKDYFVAARPDDQLGTEVSLPLGISAPIDGIGYQSSTAASNYTNVRTHDTTTDTFAHGGTAIIRSASLNGMTTAYADLSSASAATINELRLAIATQQWQEKINISGNTYKDYLRRNGVRYSDGRIQVPEYIAGGKQTVQFSEVLQTGVDSADDGVGSMKGHGIAALRSNGYVKFFEETGVLLSFLVVKPQRMYMQGVPRWLTRSTKEEFYQAEYEILGMQEIKNKEIYYAHATPNGTFGYAPRFDEYRRVPNTVHGDFTDFYKDWTLVEEFGSDPALNSTFVACNPSKRIFQDQTNPGLICNVQNKIAARRLVSSHHKFSGLKL